MAGGIQEISRNTKHVAMAAYEMLTHKIHWNGRSVVKIYGWHDVLMQGPIIAFNLLRDDGSYTGYAEVEKMANLYGIDLRTGCFCNSGACQKYLELTNNQLLQIFEKGKECGDSRDMINGRPTGAIRISFGRQSTREHVAALEQMIDYCFLGLQSSFHFDQPMKICDYSAIISSLIVYPVKSCRGIRYEKIHLTKIGLRYDRIFMIECCGSTLTQKRHQKLCKIATSIDESGTTLSLSDVDSAQSSVDVSLNNDNRASQYSVVCMNNVRTSECAAEASKWISEFLGLPNCKLRRIHKDSERSLSNEAPYLVVNEASIKILADAVGLSVSETIDRFRPNIVVRGIPPFIEDTASLMYIDSFRFEIIRKCTRCEMICVDPTTGLKDPQLIVALRDLRQREKMTFGIYVMQIGDEIGEIQQYSKVHFEQ